MNAYELAEYLDYRFTNPSLINEAANMLRQQEEKLKKYELRNQEQIKRIAELEKQSEPVAWFEQDENMKSVWYQADKHDPNAIPLYTTPQKYCPSENNAAYEKGFIEGMAKQRDSSVDKWVNATTPQTKPLSDEEIMDFVDAFGLDMGNVYEFQPKKIVEMIRAIEAKVRGEK
jgi:hypothetical protein